MSASDTFAMANAGCAFGLMEINASKETGTDCVQ